MTNPEEKRQIKTDYDNLRHTHLPNGGERMGSKPPSLEQFQQCLRTGDFGYIPLLAEAGLHVDDVYTASGPALGRAISDFNTSAVEQLLFAGANPKAAPFISKALRCVLENPSAINIFHMRSIVRLLLDAGADPNALELQTLNPLPPIFLASKAAIPDILSMLVDHGADPNSILPDGSLPIHSVFAIEHSLAPEGDFPYRKRTFDLLISFGNNPDSPNNIGMTANDIAREHNWHL